MAETPDGTRDKAEALREQALRCRRLARHTTDREVARKLLEIAEEFDQRAAEWETGKRYN